MIQSEMPVSRKFRAAAVIRRVINGGLMRVSAFAPDCFNRCSQICYFDFASGRAFWRRPKLMMPSSAPLHHLGNRS